MSTTAPPPTGSAELRQPCPSCGAALTLSWTLRAREVGSFSLAGAQLKFSATQAAIVVCEACGWRVAGQLTGATMSADGRCFTGGHFEAAAAPEPPQEAPR